MCRCKRGPDIDFHAALNDTADVHLNADTGAAPDTAGDGERPARDST
ncbi:hypothetical protein ACVBEQ_01395 [Nakamurella sp. GG22]